MLRVLVVESDRQGASLAVRALQDAGHTVLRCHDDDVAFPCNALVEGRTCPLDGDGVDVVYDHRSHPYPRPTAFEDGVSCAIRQHVPLVVGGTATLSPFEPWTMRTSGTTGDVVAACEAAAVARLTRLETPALAEVRRRLEAASGAAEAADVEIRRQGRRLAVTIHLPDGAPEIDEALAVAVAGVIRAHDRSSSQVDVAVQREAAHRAPAAI